MAQKKNKPATPEQIKIIEDTLGESLQEFAAKMSDKAYREVFARNLHKDLRRIETIAKDSAAKGMYQPILSNDYVNNINYSPLPATSDTLSRWLCNPRQYADNLRSLSQYLSYVVGQYKNFLDYKCALPAYNYVLTSLAPEIIPGEEKVFKEDLAKVYDLLRRLNIKYQSSRIRKACAYDGVYYCYINRTNESNYLIQLPSAACYITAPWGYGWRFCVDLAYFDKYIGLKDVIPELSAAYEAFIQAREAAIRGEDVVPQQYYLMPVEKSWCFTSDILHADVVPEGASTMGAALDILSYKNVLKNKLIYELYKIIALKIPMKKSGDQLAITFQEAQQMIEAIKAELPENVTAYASPFDSLAIPTDQVDNLSSYVNLGTDSFSSSSGIPQAFLGGDDELHQGSALTVVNNIEFVKTSKDFYSQIENFVNFQLQILPTRYKFAIHMFGNATEKEKEISLYAGLITTMNLSPEWALAAMGLEPYEIKSTLQMSDMLGTRDLLKPIVTAYNGAAAQKSAGRPQESEDGSTSDGASIHRDYQE